MNVLYPNPYCNEVCSKGTALYIYMYMMVYNKGVYLFFYCLHTVQKK